MIHLLAVLMLFAKKETELAHVLVFLSIMVILTTSANQSALSILIAIARRPASIRSAVIHVQEYAARMLNATLLTIRQVVIACQVSLEIHKSDAVHLRKVIIFTLRP